MRLFRPTLCQAMQRVASYEGDLVSETYMRDYYRDTAKATDPHVEWRYYADLRDKQEQYDAEIVLVKQRLNEAKAKLNALKERK